MEKVLNQEEIDAMVRAARSGNGSPITKPAQFHIEAWDVRRSGQIGREQLQAISQLHEAFARNLTHFLGAHLRVVFNVVLVSAEHLSYYEFLQRIPETTYLASCRLDPMGAGAALQFDLKVAFPMIDLLLGGEGKSLPPAREISEIEEQVLDSVARIVCRELGAAWQALSLEVSFEQCIESGAAQRLMAPEEKVLSLNFEITMPETRGGMTLAVPFAVSSALLRKITAEWTHKPSRTGSDFRQRFMRRLLACPFQLELRTGNMHVPVSALAQLAPGDVMTFDRKANDPASLFIEGREVFRAVPARCGAVRAARVLDRISELPEHIPGREKSK